MIAGFAGFFLRNEKITFIFILIISIFGLISYLLLPKQYNPSIVAPAFIIEVPSYGYSAKEWQEYIVKWIENKVRELVWVDKVFGYSSDGFVSVMVTFRVWVDQEVAKTRIYDKIYSNYDLRPFGISDIRIKSIDPEDLPQITFAIRYTGTGNDLDTKGQGQYLQNIAKILRENLKTIEGTTVIDIVWGYSNDLSIELIPERIESFWLDISQIIAKLKESFWKSIVGEISNEDGKFPIYLDQNTDTIKRLKNFPIRIDGEKKILLQDVASAKEWEGYITKKYEYASLSGMNTAVFLGVAKLKWTNSVTITERIHEMINEMKKTLPKNIEITTIQDEWETAKEATNELMIHLFVSIAIVLIILIIFLGIRDAINAAFCIPMVLGIVFIIAMILGLDINRITLFALILSLGILVDDSIVMVENNSRHLSMMPRTGKTKYEAIIDSVREVGMSIVLSTITRIISFVAMFAVTGMMGDYMKPIPIFASIALTASLVVAFSINPFLASWLHKSGGGSHEQKEWWFIRWYGKKLESFVNRDLKTEKRRTWLKIGFWISLFLIILSPIYLDIFKARMLPKADKDQVYLWIDAPGNRGIETTEQIAHDVETFFLWYKKLSPQESISGEYQKYSRILPKDLRIVESTSTSIGDRLTADFSNLFRGWNNRINENQITMRINLISSKMRNMKSEEWVIQVRPLLVNMLTKKYKDIKIRLLEDPPGPPTQATFHLKVQGSPEVDTSSLTHFYEIIEQIVEGIKKDEWIVDLTNSLSSTSPAIHITLDHDRIQEAWVSENQIQNTLQMYYGRTPLSITRYDGEKYGASQIFASIQYNEKTNISQLNSLNFLGKNNDTIALSDIAEIKTDFKSHDIYTDERRETIHLYGEMWANSVVYPIIKLYWIFWSSEFEKSGYKKISATPYGITFIWIKDGKKYEIRWWGEWELTMDTFRDLGLAMIFSLFVIYFIIVTQFWSFIVWGIIMTTFLLSFFWIFPGFSILFITSGTYFTATAMIGAIALWGIVVGNALILIDYINQLLSEGKSIEYSVIVGSKKRFVPVMLTSIAAVAGSFIITSDPVWSGLAWSIIWWLSASAVLTLYLIPIFYYTYLRKYHKEDPNSIQFSHIIENEKILSNHK